MIQFEALAIHYFLPSIDLPPNIIFSCVAIGISGKEGPYQGRLPQRGFAGSPLAALSAGVNHAYGDVILSL
jgi:hypothetical protein